MRKIGAIFGITAFGAVICLPLPVAAFSIHLGPYYIHVPFGGHHHHHRLQMRANEARTKQSDVSRGGAAKTEQADRDGRVETNTQPFGSCTGLMPGAANLPIEQIRQTVQPTADQEPAFDDLKAASSQASDIIKSSCASSVPLTPIGRLDAAAQRVDATIKGIEVIRGALARFDDLPSDEQKRRFNAIDDSSQRTRSADMAAICSQQAGGFIDLPVQRIEEVIQPTAQQRSTFEDLKNATQNSADKLRSSCPTAVPVSPMARLDTVGTRLRAMADAIKSIRPAFENFYASLSDEQKARFNMLGPPPRAASSQPQSGGR